MPDGIFGRLALLYWVVIEKRSEIRVVVKWINVFFIYEFKLLSLADQHSGITYLYQIYTSLYKVGINNLIQR